MIKSKADNWNELWIEVKWTNGKGTKKASRDTVNEEKG